MVGALHQYSFAAPHALRPSAAAVLSSGPHGCSRAVRMPSRVAPLTGARLGVQAESLREASPGDFAALCRKGRDERPSAALRSALAAFTPVFAILALRKAWLLSLLRRGSERRDYHARPESRAAHRPCWAGPRDEVHPDRHRPDHVQR